MKGLQLIDMQIVNLLGTQRLGAALASCVSLLVAAIVFVGPTLAVVADWTQAKKIIPPVLLSDQHQAMCKVGVGDVMPAFELAQIDGEKAKLADHFGKQATVVFVFKADQRMSRTGLADMETDVVGEFGKQSVLGKQGVKVVAVAVDGSTEAVQKLMTDTKASFPVLLDPQEKFFAAVGTEKLPRIYLLDSAGKILWFDIEYSLATRRELRRALGSRLPEAALP